MLGNIIRLWLVAPDKVATAGWNRKGVRVGFALTPGSAWIQIPIYRDTTKYSGKVSPVNTFDISASTAANFKDVNGRMYVCLFQTADGKQYLVGDGRAFKVNLDFSSGQTPGDETAISIKLSGNSLSVYHEMETIVVPTPDPVNLTEREEFDTLDNVYFSTYPVGLDGCHSQPEPGTLRLLVPYFESIPGGGTVIQSMVHIPFHEARRFTRVKIKFSALSDIPSVFTPPTGFKAVTPSGSFATTFNPSSLEWEYVPANHGDSGNPVEEFVFTFSDTIGQGSAYVDIDYIEWTWES